MRKVHAILIHLNALFSLVVFRYHAYQSPRPRRSLNSACTEFEGGGGSVEMDYPLVVLRPVIGEFI